ncbi:MAG: capsular polysaccharide synthesis protein [Clostridia bacterium]|nr:capsular polysaccharide synthesis protein [Clostridia bacterium]
MRNKHNNLKRIKHRIFEELSATKKIAQKTSWRKAFSTLIAKVDIQIMNHNSYEESQKITKRLMKKHEVMMEYIEKDFSNFIKDYDFDNVKLIDSDKKLKDKIWICWWQGVENAPEIVRSCINSIKKYIKQHEIIILTEENYHEYVKFPDWIEEKKKKGIISRTHYSDLLRLEILANYGGIWLDSTFFCNSPKIEEYFNYPLWSIKRPDYGHCSVACGYFANYSLGCNYENRKIFAVIRDFLLQYWSENNEIIDYLLTDYLIVLAQRHDKAIAEAFEAIPNSNPECDELFKILQEPYEQQLWEKLSKDTILFKLTWKQSFPKEKDGKKTFYGMLVDGKL